MSQKRPDKTDDACIQLEIKYEKKIQQLEQKVDSKDEELNKKDEELKKKDEELNKKDEELKKKDHIINTLMSRVNTLEEDNSNLEKNNTAIKKQSQKKDTTIQNYEAKLNYYENAHTPSSKQGAIHPNKSKSNKSKNNKSKTSAQNKNNTNGAKTDKVKPNKRSGVLGHNGGTHIFKPTEKKRHVATCCPECGKNNIQDLHKDKKRTIVSIPEFVPHTVTLHKTAQYNCLDCGAKFQAKNNLPPTGQFDYSVIRYVTYQSTHRKTPKMVSEDFKNLFKLDVSDTTIRNIYDRQTILLKPIRDGFMAELEKSRSVIMDETEYKGEPKRWIMAVRNDDTVAYLHSQNRSAKDLIAQAKNCIGAISRDGYRGYDTVFPNHIKQRCTQHIVRESRTISNRSELESATNLYNELNKKFIALRKWTRGDRSLKSRRSYVTKLQKWLCNIISRYKKSRYEIMKKFGTTLKNAAPELFTFVLYPFVYSTTNIGEQSMKPVIGQRNSHLQLKSDKGAENLCVMLSCVETWKLRGLNVWEELCKIIGPPSDDAS